MWFSCWFYKRRNQKIVKITKNKIPFLIPGIGSQGGDLEMMLKAIKENLSIHRISASSSLAYAYEKYNLNPKNAALKEAQKLNDKARVFF
jgi:orotidine-5'-phosphate decarboxylase